jgi:hypothetical protein
MTRKVMDNFRERLQECVINNCRHLSDVIIKCVLFINKRIFCVPCFVWFLLPFKMWELFLPHPIACRITNHSHKLKLVLSHFLWGRNKFLVSLNWCVSRTLSVFLPLSIFLCVGSLWIIQLRLNGFRKFVFLCWIVLWLSPLNMFFCMTCSELLTKFLFNLIIRHTIEPFLDLKSG